LSLKTTVHFLFHGHWANAHRSPSANLPTIQLTEHFATTTTPPFARPTHW
jgi:hypothetical protein